MASIYVLILTANINRRSFRRLSYSILGWTLVAPSILRSSIFYGQSSITRYEDSILGFKWLTVLAPGYNRLGRSLSVTSQSQWGTCEHLHSHTNWTWDSLSLVQCIDCTSVGCNTRNDWFWNRPKKRALLYSIHSKRWQTERRTVRRMVERNDWMTLWLTNRETNWLTYIKNRQTDRQTDRLTDWLTKSSLCVWATSNLQLLLNSNFHGTVSPEFAGSHSYTL